MPDGPKSDGNGAEEVLDRVRRVCGNLDILAAFRSVRQIIGPQVFPKGEELAADAMAALREGKVPTPIQRAALEAAIKALRPYIPQLSSGICHKLERIPLHISLVRIFRWKDRPSR